MPLTVQGRTVAGRKFEIRVEDERGIAVDLIDEAGQRHNVCVQEMLPEPIRTLRYTLRRARELSAHACRDAESAQFAAAFIAALERGLTPELEQWGIRPPEFRPDLLRE